VGSLRFILSIGLVCYLFFSPFARVQIHYGAARPGVWKTGGERDGEKDADDRLAADAFEDVFKEESDTDSLVMDVPVMSGGNGQ
jgi:hypothetical protein